MLEVDILEGPTERSPGELSVIFTPTRAVRNVRVSVCYDQYGPRGDGVPTITFRPDHGGYWINRINAGETVTRLFTILAEGVSLHANYRGFAEVRFRTDGPEGTATHGTERQPFEFTVEAPAVLYVLLGAAGHAWRIATAVYESFHHSGREMYPRHIQRPMVTAAKTARAKGFGWAVDAVEAGARFVTRPGRPTKRRK